MRPVARVAVDTPLAHLDRPFDYLVDETQDEAAQPGVRVRVRFAGRLVGGFVLDRVDASDHEGRLTYLDRVVSPEPVLSAEVARLARAVADRWAGTLADVLRLAVPPRHATTESAPAATDATDATDTAAPSATPGSTPGPACGADQFDRYAGGADFLAALTAGLSPRAVLVATPGDWPALLAAAAAATIHSGRGVVLVLPDHRDVARVDTALTAALGTGCHVALTADLGPAARYRRFLALCRGNVACVVGTRAAVWAPVHRLGLAVVWDDGDDLLAEPRAPYAHARDVAVLRAHLEGSGLLLAGHAVTAEALALTSSGWAQLLEPTPAARTATLPAVATAADDAPDDPLARAARLPTLAWRTARDALAAGTAVLVQVPRRGYQPALACASCRTPARCPSCAGPLGRRDAGATVTCRWCAAAAPGWRCPACGHADLRAVVVGARRTAEELGRAFPGVPVRTSGGDHVLAEVTEGAAVVVATPGAEPVAAGGYGAALLLDGWALLSRPDLRAGEETLRRWLNAAALVRSRGAGGRVVVAAPGELRPVQALLRWQPRWHAERETEDRAGLHLPPTARMAAVSGTPAAIAELLELASFPAGTEMFGPAPLPTRDAGEGPTERMLVRVPRRSGLELATALKQAAGVRTARKAADPVRIELDPQELA